MNNRIEDIARQCMSMRFFVDTASEEFDYKKFAELIIRECACIADDMKSLETARSIKERFGLEEGTMNTFTPIDPGPAATKEIADARNDVLDGLL